MAWACRWLDSPRCFSAMSCALGAGSVAANGRVKHANGEPGGRSGNESAVTVAASRCDPVLPQCGAVVPQPGQRQGKEGLDAGAQGAVRPHERSVDLGVGPGGVRRIVDAPVRAQHRPEVCRTSLAGRAGADSHHDVRGEREVVPRLAVAAIRRDPFARQQGERSRMHLACGPAARTRRVPARWREVVERCFREDGAARVAGAEEENVHGSG